MKLDQPRGIFPPRIGILFNETSPGLWLPGALSVQPVCPYFGGRMLNLGSWSVETWKTLTSHKRMTNEDDQSILIERLSSQPQGLFRTNITLKRCSHGVTANLSELWEINNYSHQVPTFLATPITRDWRSTTFPSFFSTFLICRMQKLTTILYGAPGYNVLSVTSNILFTCPIGLSESVLVTTAARGQMWIQVVTFGLLHIQLQSCTWQTIGLTIDWQLWCKHRRVVFKHPRSSSPIMTKTCSPNYLDLK